MMLSFAALVLVAVLSKLLGNQVFTPLSVALAAGLFLLRYLWEGERRRTIELFLLQFGVLLYALANQDPSYHEHAALAICLIPSWDRLRRVGQAAVAESSIAVVLLYILWSATWTSNLEMSVSGFVMSGLCLAFLVSFVLQLQGDLGRVFGQVLLVMAAVMVGSWVAGGLGIGSAGKTFAGVTLHRNHLGFLLGLMILLCLFAVRWRFRWLHLAGAVAAAGLLLYIDSKSAIVSIVFTAVVLFVVSARRWKIALGLLVLGIAVFIGSLPSPKMDHFALWLGRDPTFTSRTEIWAGSIGLASEQPFTGYGYNAVWSAHENRLAQYPDAPGPRYAHAHNAWIDWVLQLGLGGLAVYLVFLGLLLKRALDIARRPGGGPLAIQALCLLVYIQVYDLANVSTIPVTRFGFFMLATATLSLWLHRAAGEGLRLLDAPPAAPLRAWSDFGRAPASRPGATRAALGLGLACAGFVAMTAYALWEDGRRFAAADKRGQPAPIGVQAASTLDPKEFQWKTAERLHDYARRHREALQAMMGRSEGP